MAIPVICPSCKKSFRVSEKFAGKKGPCPNCKATIKIPAAAEVKIHAPEADATADAQRKQISKPIARKDTSLSPLQMGLVGGGILLTLIAALLIRGALQNVPLFRLLGLLAVTPPLVWSGYLFTRDAELEPHRGRSLWLRVAICSLVYAGLWVAFHFVPAPYTKEMWHWFFLSAPFLIFGALAGFASFDLEFGNGFMHYSFYLIGTLILAYLAKVGPFLEVTAAATS